MKPASVDIFYLVYPEEYNYGLFSICGTFKEAKKEARRIGPFSEIQRVIKKKNKRRSYSHVIDQYIYTPKDFN